MSLAVRAAASALKQVAARFKDPALQLGEVLQQARQAAASRARRPGRRRVSRIFPPVPSTRLRTSDWRKSRSALSATLRPVEDAAQLVQELHAEPASGLPLQGFKLGAVPPRRPGPRLQGLEGGVRRFAGAAALPAAISLSAWSWSLVRSLSPLRSSRMNLKPPALPRPLTGGGPSTLMTASGTSADNRFCSRPMIACRSSARRAPGPARGGGRSLQGDEEVAEVGAVGLQRERLAGDRR